MKQISEQNNFVYLLVALVFFLLLGAIVEQLQLSFGQRLVQSSTVVVIAIGVWSFRATKRRYWTGLGLLAAITVVVIIGLILESAGLNYIHLLLLLAFFIWATWLAARQVLFTGIIDGHKIIGAICIYLLLGLIWALMYLLIAEAVPEALNGLQQAPWYENFSALSYFSFVTLTTLGYGDISPASPIAQFLAYMEAVVGIFYTAILVASLIGARMSVRKVQDR
ncbi:MAG: potassium channel family protein [Gammaproteobacteria bacterium]|nr:MAG: potassium channel family protein [Gammaproteobacteria bacterium]